MAKILNNIDIERLRLAEEKMIELAKNPNVNDWKFKASMTEFINQTKYLVR